MSYNPIIIVGSVRSGTNMLRDTLSKIPNYGTWDCDEINPIWRHGNINHPNDELTPEMVTPEIRKFIRKEFQKLANQLNVENVVEKTTATSLRVAYTHKVFPEAKYIFLYRDGRDVAVSAQKRWNAPFDFTYSYKKFRYVPLVDMPYILYYYTKNRIGKMVSGAKTYRTWGPRYNGIDDDVKNYSLLEVCGLQWKHYVESSLEQMEDIPENQLLKVQYERLVTHPREEINRICDFLEIAPEQIEAYGLHQGINARSIGNWKKLNPQNQELLNNLLTPTLKKLGYN